MPFSRRDPPNGFTTQEREEFCAYKRTSAKTELSKYELDNVNVHPFVDQVLRWDYYSKEPSPVLQEGYTSAPKTGGTEKDNDDGLADYVKKHTKFLHLECWQSILTTQREGYETPFEITIVRQLKDSAGSTVYLAESKSFIVLSKELVVTDLLLLTKDKHDHKQKQVHPHLFAEVIAVEKRRPKINPDNTIRFLLRTGIAKENMEAGFVHPFQTVVDNARYVFGVRVSSMMPVKREYCALHALQDYTLRKNVLQGLSAPQQDYNAKEIAAIESGFGINELQAKALYNSTQNKAGFSLVQGPPGTGKTRTVLGMLGSLFSPQHNSDNALKRVLVCTPSNAGIDEITSPIRTNGVFSQAGEKLDLRMVRLGRPKKIAAENYIVSLQGQAFRAIDIPFADDDNDDNSQKGSGSLWRRKYDPSVPRRLKELKAREKSLVMRLRRTTGGNSGTQDSMRVQVQINEVRGQIARLGDLSSRQWSEIKSKFVALKAEEKKLVWDAHIVCTTLSGSAHPILQDLALDFDTVIIDEAGQCTESSILIPLQYGCQRCILVGDPKQLPPTVISQLAVEQGFSVSLFDRLDTNAPENTVMLNTQFRMHPHIAHFPSTEFYGGKLLTHASNAARRQQEWHSSDNDGDFQPYRFFHVDSTHAKCLRTGSISNRTEALAVLAMFERIAAHHTGGLDALKGQVGIISPYKLQVEVLREAFEELLDVSSCLPDDGSDDDEIDLHRRADRKRLEVLDHIDFKTIDGYQGQEKPIILMS